MFDVRSEIWPRLLIILVWKIESNKLQQDLFGIVLKWRTYFCKNCCCRKKSADISKSAKHFKAATRIFLAIKCFSTSMLNFKFPTKFCQILMLRINIRHIGMWEKEKNHTKKLRSSIPGNNFSDSSRLGFEYQ